MTTRIGIMCHMFHADQFEMFRTIFERVPGANLHLTTCSAENAELLRKLFSHWPSSVSILHIENRGRDIAPKIIALAPAHAEYDLVLHLHTKASYPEWREHMIQRLVGSTMHAERIIQRFAADLTLGLLAPVYWPPSRPWIGWGANRWAAKGLMMQMGINPATFKALHFPAGSMFWARPSALRPIFELGLQNIDFPSEPIGDDGTLAHAIERLYFIACEKAGYRWDMVAEEAASIWTMKEEDFWPDASR